VPPAPVDSTGANRSECSCSKVSDILTNANLALADLLDEPYGSETSKALPLVG
jgi:hypothetical protein